MKIIKILSVTFLTFIFSQANAQIDFECKTELILFPKEFDFSSEKEGRVLISSPDNVFHTSYQTVDGEVNIKATLPIELLNKDVFFKIIDIKDNSPYISGLEGDNIDDEYMLIGSDQVISLDNHIYKKVANEQETIQETSRAVAKLKLSFTKQNSGDNYKIIASTSPNFDDPQYLDETTELVAWKRMNYRVSNMYSQGGMLGEDFNPDNNSMDDRLNLFPIDANEFEIGDNVEIWDNEGTVEQTTITNIVQNLFFTDVYVTDLNNSFSEFSGIRKSNHKIEFEIQHEMITNAYGLKTDGLDGGTFVEWEELPLGSEMIPKLDLTKHYFNDDFIAGLYFNTFIEYWTDKLDKNNIIKLIMAFKGKNSNNLGFHSGDANIANVFFGQIEETYNNESSTIQRIVASSIVVHEFGHHFDVANEHVDNNDFSSSSDHEGVGNCVMSYLHDFLTSHVEFDSNSDGCINDIRNADNPR